MKCLTTFFVALSAAAMASTAANADSEQPQVQAHCGDVPVKRFGFCWVLGEAPSLLDDVPLQVGNAAPRVKVHPKDSSQIRRNYLGVTTTRMPRSTENDYLPVEAIHLIDGNLQTCWLSHGQTRPDAQPVWIRLDLPLERQIDRVVLRKRPPSGQARSTLGWVPIRDAAEVGRGMPATLTIKVSRDSREWETVFDGPSGDRPEKLDYEFRFAARPAKQIWITAGNLPLVENILYAFSLAEVEVYDASGKNVALATCGTGVTVNSTHHSPGMELAAHRWYWPLHYDAGFKWARVGYHDDPINWHWVEKQKGVLAIDPETDAAVTELVSHGVEMVMSLNFGNRLYSGPAGRAIPQLWEWNYDMPAPPTTPEALASWTRYVEFMVKHFRDRVKHFEIWNEWNISCYWGAKPSVEHYLAVARAAIPVIRKHAPGAKIMMGSWAGFPHGISTWSPAQLAAREKQTLYLAATRELAHEVDEIGWHPFYQTDPERLQRYTADVRALQKWLRDVGFRGHCMVTEWNYSAVYPPLSEAEAKRAWCGGFKATEIEKAKYVAQVFTRHTALGLESFFCEMYFPYFTLLDLSLLRRSFDADPIAPLQPQAAYYVTRNLATMLDGLEPGELQFAVDSAPPHLESFALKSPDGPALAFWLGGHAKDHCEGVPVDVRLKTPCRKAIAYDPMNGVSQELNVTPTAEGVLLKGVVVRDWPLIVRLPGMGLAAPASDKRATIYVSRLGDDSDGTSWPKAFRTIQKALLAVPDARGGHRIIVRPDTYVEANLYPAFKGAEGAYNLLLGDADGRLGSGATGWVVIDSGDPQKGFKSLDWWSTFRATTKGWSPAHSEPTFSSIGWDRWAFRNLYATGGDAGLFWDLTDKSGQGFTVIVEDCVGIGRAFGGGFGYPVTREKEPIVFRRCYLMSLDWWGDAGGLAVGAYNTSTPKHPDAICEDCTFVGPDNAVQILFPSKYIRLKMKDCRLIVLNFSQPVGTPSTGIISSIVAKPEQVHIDFEDCALMGYKVFGARADAAKNKNATGAIHYTTQGRVQAYVQYQQPVPQGFERLGRWPAELFDYLAPPAAK